MLSMFTAPADGGEGSARAIQSAIKDGGLTPEDIDYVNAHGTSTPLNDKNESAAIKSVFGAHTANIAINSTKSMVGHMLGAAAGIEAIVCCLSIRDSKIHATVNYENPDPDCDLNYTPINPIDKEVRAAVSNSLGFGGHNSAIVIKKFVK